MRTVRALSGEQSKGRHSQDRLADREDAQRRTEPERQQLAEQVGAQPETGEQNEDVEARGTARSLGPADVSDDASQKRLREVVADRDDEDGDRADDDAGVRDEQRGAGRANREPSGKDAAAAVTVCSTADPGAQQEPGNPVADDGDGDADLPQSIPAGEVEPEPGEQPGMEDRLSAT